MGSRVLKTLKLGALSCVQHRSFHSGCKPMGPDEEKITQCRVHPFSHEMNRIPEPCMFPLTQLQAAHRHPKYASASDSLSSMTSVIFCLGSSRAKRSYLIRKNNPLLPKTDILDHNPTKDDDIHELPPPESVIAKNSTANDRSFHHRSAAVTTKSLQSCPTLCDPTDGSPQGSSVPGILQARTLEWVAISFSNACIHAKSLQSCPILCNPMDRGPQGSSVHWILWARIMEWVAVSFSRP